MRLLEMKYDYIFSGVGLAALMVLHEMKRSGLLSEKRILLLEPSNKDQNDRTWCFWENQASDWDWAVSKQWTEGGFKNGQLYIECFSDEFRYKMIESKTFYSRIVSELKSSPEIEWRKEKVVSFVEDSQEVKVFTEDFAFSGQFLFNSVLDVNRLKNNENFPLLLQHFEGWFVKTKRPVFERNRAIFMDFSVPQKNNTRFMYVLPISENEALIEYTLFSAEVLREDEYAVEIQAYLKNKGIDEFDIIRKEKGIIPMSVFPLWKGNSKRILNIGSAGGWTKASTGYTFKNSSKFSKKVVEVLKCESIDFRAFYKRNRFTFYDELFVSVLFKNNEIGSRLFSRMFTRVNPWLVFKFLDEKTTISEELKIIWSCPKLPFLNALLKFCCRKLFPR